MPFDRPTLPALIARTRADIQTQLVGIDPYLRRQIEGVLAKMLSALAHGLHGHLLWLSRQIMPDTAEAEFLERWASIYGLTRKAAVQATGDIVITGVDTTVVPAGTVWQRADGVQYEQDGDATIGSVTPGEVTTSVTAILPVPVDGIVEGSDGNADSGTTVSLVTPQTDVDTDATVDTDGLTGGTNTETGPELLSRLLSRMRTPPKGGGPGDYVNWALEVSGVTRAWEFPRYLGPGTVGVFFVRDNDGTGVAILPDLAERTTMLDYLNTKRPPTASIVTEATGVATPALTGVALDVTLTTLTPNTVAVQTAIETELADYVLRTAEPAVLHYLSQINEAISLATGEVDHVTSIPAANVQLTAGQILIEGALAHP